MISALVRAGRRLLDQLAAPYVSPFRRIAQVDPGAQRLLQWQYRALAASEQPPPMFDEVGFRAYSQTNEDGILLYLFAVLGTTDRRVVEICVEEGIECNAANLIINHGWRGLLFDGSARNVQAGRRFYARCRDTWIRPPEFVQAWVTAENVDGLIAAQGYTGDIDLLCIDVDGMDYWIWKAIHCVRPRVVVVEYHAGLTRAVSRAYDPEFGRARASFGNGGASLPAMAALGRAKGYRLVGCNRYGFNAFFVRVDLISDRLPEVSVEACLEVARRRWSGPAPLSDDLPPGWVDV